MRRVNVQALSPALPCWEYLDCRATDDCPAYHDHGFDCFVVTGTLCWGEIQGDFDQKISDCRGMCRYYGECIAEEPEQEADSAPA